jgi:hypothetical protein
MLEVTEIEGLNILRLELCSHRHARELNRISVGIQEQTVATRPRTIS